MHGKNGVGALYERRDWGNGLGRLELARPSGWGKVWLSVLSVSSCSIPNCFDTENEIGFSGPVKPNRLVGLVSFVVFTLISCSASEPVRVVELWPNGAPGEKGTIGEARDTTKPTDPLIAGKSVIRLDDPVRVENALLYALALRNDNVPVELHVYPAGGHGYGLRRTKEPVTTWPDRVADWMRNRGLLDRR